MKKTLYLSLLMALLWACAESTRSVTGEGPRSSQKAMAVQQSSPTKDLITTADAEKILGEQAHLADSSTTGKQGSLNYLCSYVSNAKDEVTGKTGALYFLLERYSEITSAKTKYSNIKKANESHEGIKTLNDIGDEAYFHSDGQNFYFIMVRKGSNVFNMKVNKITSHTSLEAFHKVARKITEGL